MYLCFLFFSVRWKLHGFPPSKSRWDRIPHCKQPRFQWRFDLRTWLWPPDITPHLFERWNLWTWTSLSRSLLSHLQCVCVCVLGCFFFNCNRICTSIYIHMKSHEIIRLFFFISAIASCCFFFDNLTNRPTCSWVRKELASDWAWSICSCVVESLTSCADKKGGSKISVATGDTIDTNVVWYANSDLVTTITSCIATSCLWPNMCTNKIDQKNIKKTRSQLQLGFIHPFGGWPWEFWTIFT